MSPFILLLSVIFLAGSATAGVIGGHYGGHLKASSVEAHDFSEGLAHYESSNYESLGALGDHLKESHFPSDYEHEYKGGEYEEAAAAAGGGGYEHQHYAQDENEHKSFDSLHDAHSDLHDFDTKPVPGINHGKGALSYSTTYEFKDAKP